MVSDELLQQKVAARSNCFNAVTDDISFGMLFPLKSNTTNVVSDNNLVPMDMIDILPFRSNIIIFARRTKRRKGNTSETQFYECYSFRSDDDI
jgi:hypothetical protein